VLACGPVPPKVNGATCGIAENEEVVGTKVDTVAFLPSGIPALPPPCIGLLAPISMVESDGLFMVIGLGFLAVGSCSGERKVLIVPAVPVFPKEKVAEGTGGVPNEKVVEVGFGNCVRLLPRANADSEIGFVPNTNGASAPVELDTGGCPKTNGVPTFGANPNAAGAAAVESSGLSTLVPNAGRLVDEAAEPTGLTPEKYAPGMDGAPTATPDTLFENEKKKNELFVS
jgi:hypothetical protein